MGIGFGPGLARIFKDAERNFRETAKVETTTYVQLYNSPDSPKLYKGSSHCFGDCPDNQLSITNGEVCDITGVFKDTTHYDKKCLPVNDPQSVYTPDGLTGTPCPGALRIDWVDDNPSTGILECTYNNSTIDVYENNPVIRKAGYANKSIYDQLIYGMAGTYTVKGKCEDPNNLQVVVGANGKTCADVIKDKNEEKAYCDANPSDPMCACYNITNGLEYCAQDKYKDLPGCKAVNKNRQIYKSLGIEESIGVSCLTPGTCSGNVYIPQNPPQPCDRTLQICEQINNISNTTVTGNLDIISQCKNDAKKSGSAPSKPSDPSADPSPDPSPGKPNWFAKNRTALIIGVVGLFLIILIMLLR